jgi:hypothetical protein
MAELTALQQVVLEVERHAAKSGWDQPASVFALVDTTDLLQREPQLAALLGIEEADPGALTPVEQEPASETLEELLATILWPPEVAGCAVVLEASTDEPGAGPDSGPDSVPDPGPSPGDARIVAGALRSGEGFCAVRQRAHDEDDLVLTGPDLVPGLLQLLHATLEPDAGDAPAVSESAMNVPEA